MAFTQPPMLDDAIRQVNPKLTGDKARDIVRDIYQYSAAFDVDPRLVAAVIAVESSFKVDAVGSSGEVGLMQLMPKYHGHPETLKYTTNNIVTGVKYLSAMQILFKHYGPYRWLEMYNRGPNCKPPKKFPYTKKVLKFYKQFGGRVDDTRTATTIVQSTQKRGDDNRRATSSRKETS